MPKRLTPEEIRAVAKRRVARYVAKRKATVFWTYAPLAVFGLLVFRALNRR